METTLSERAQKTARFINYTNKPIFLTGKAGTGKTTFLRYILKHTHKKTAVVAPTGIAAINAGGSTIHSFFQLPFGSFIPQKLNDNSGINFNCIDPDALIRKLQMTDRKRAILRELELLIIDEVSMLRADLLDAIDIVLKHIRRRRAQPFGGVQVLFIGDLLQLPPVVKHEEWNTLSQFYNSAYFFDSKVLRENPCVYIELDKIYRQNDQVFIDLLNNLRNNKITREDIELLNQHYKPDFRPNVKDKYITLTTHNYKADNLNRDQLERLKNKTITFKAEVGKDFPEYMYPVEFNLQLKVGAQVMFIKNDPSGKQRFFNGKIGEISSLTNGIWVTFSDQPDPVEVEKYPWENKRYKLNENTNEIEEEIVGTFVQYPIKLAWAITVHKSQGLTFDKAILDISDAFAPGQVYVALSRLRSMDGLILSSPLQTSQLLSDQKISQYTSQGELQQHNEEELKRESLQYLHEFILRAYNLNWLHHNLQEHLATYNKDESRSVKQKYHTFVVNLFEQVNELKKHGEGFGAQTGQILAAKQEGYEAHLAKRCSDARQYFTPRLKKCSTTLLEELGKICEEERVNLLTEELLFIEGLIFEQQQLIQRATELCNSYVNNFKTPEETRVNTAERVQKRIELEEKLKSRKKSKNTGKKEKKTSQTKKEKSSKSSKPKGRQHTLELIKKGKTVAEISALQEYTASTIESHIAQLIAEGELSPWLYISKETAQSILSKAKQLGDYKLSPLKEALNNQYSYFELKVAIASISHS